MVNNLDVSSSIFGGYLSSEQIDLLTIIQCENFEELVEFVLNCDQINQNDDLVNQVSKKNDLEEAKRYIFRIYQDTMVYHNQSKEDSRIRRLEYLGIKPEDLMSVIERKYPNSERILELNHHFISEERDQNKSNDLYEELCILNDSLSNFNSILMGSGKIYTVVNKYYKENRFDFYHAKRDLEFARKNGKQVRYHSLLVRDDASHLFDGKNKDEILQILCDYVKASIDFINEYNNTHFVEINGEQKPIINAVDLFNEIVSFDKMSFDKRNRRWNIVKKNPETGNEEIVNDDGSFRSLSEYDSVPEYQSIWEINYGISIDELMEVFEYARINKPDGVNYLYNEPFLENDERRKKVFEILELIDSKSSGLIDTLGSQMHITMGEDYSKIERCLSDFKKLQDIKGKKIQITEFDMSLGSNEISRVFGPNADIYLQQVYEIKKERIGQISKIIRDSGVELSGVSYWSLTDGIDCNLERIRSNMLNNKQISDISQIPTACGGLIPTHKKYIYNINNMDNKINIEGNFNKQR